MFYRLINTLKKTVCVASLGAVLLSSFSCVQASGINVTVNGKQYSTPAETSVSKDATTKDAATTDNNAKDAAVAENVASDTVASGLATTVNTQYIDGYKPFVNDFNGDGQIIVVIDPGHGGKNTGTGWNGIPEKEFSLKVAHALYDELTQYDDVTVYLTHDDLDVDYSLDDRADFAHAKNADFLVSLHFNGTEAHDMYGTDVFIPITPSVNYQSFQMADLIEDNLAELGILVRGIKNFWRDNREYYGIIRHCTEYNIPSVIVEHCHFDNPNDNQFLDTEEKIANMGKADATAIAQYFGLSSKARDITYSGGRAVYIDPEVIHGEADETKPVECKIECNSLNAETGEATINITAYDNESSMLYYSISRDGGNSYGELKVWPGNDPIARTSPRTVTVSVGKIKSDTVLSVKAYNYFEQKIASKTINFSKYFSDSAARNELNNAARAVDPEEVPQVGVSRARYNIKPEKLTKEVVAEQVEDKPQPVEKEKKPFNFKTAVIVVLILIMVFIMAMSVMFFIEVQQRKRRRRRRQKAHEEEMRRIGRS